MLLKRITKAAFSKEKATGEEFTIKLDLKIDYQTISYEFTGNAPIGVRVDQWKEALASCAKNTSIPSNITENPLKAIHESCLNRFECIALGI